MKVQGACLLHEFHALMSLIDKLVIITEASEAYMDPQNVVMMFPWSSCLSGIKTNHFDAGAQIAKTEYLTLCI